MHLDNEAHVLIACPHHGEAREACVSKLSQETYSRLSAVHTAEDKMHAMLASHVPADWEALGLFANRLRQQRAPPSPSVRTIIRNVP